MIFEFKNYQENAIVRLKRQINELLETDENKVCVFKAPTGSGKTLMMAEFLKRLIDSRIDRKQFSFVWIAVNKLHDQSRNSLRKYYDQNGVGIKCSYFDDLGDRKIGENEILFLNWASINKKDNIYVSANEYNNNLSNIIERTKNEGRIIILIVDESHNTAGSAISKGIIDDLAPKITIEVSATPKIESDYRVVIEPSEVRIDGMIKNEILVNPDFENFIVDETKNDRAADEIILEEAIKKRMQLRKKFEALGSNVNPLLLIQLPDKKGDYDKKDEIIAMLTEFGYTTENGRLAIYLSDKNEKINLANIEKNENEVEIMLFKQAIALGWDCPRASILVLFRQWSEENFTFSIQTLGRIMRMPEQKHYVDPALNTAYVFTSLPDIQTRIDENILKDFKVFSGKRISEYKDLNLTSYHTKRFREETRLSSDFNQHFINSGNKLKLKGKFVLDHNTVNTKLIVGGRIVDSDKESKSIFKVGTLDVRKNEVELQNAFDMFVRNNLAPFASEQRSLGRIKSSIYQFFDVSRNEDEWSKIQAAVLADENRQSVIDVINLAKETYQQEVGKGKNQLIRNEEMWNIPKQINYSLGFIKKDYKKSVIQPYYAKTSGINKLNLSEEDSLIEVEFMNFLEKSKGVVWWFKNGRSDATYFAVPYLEHEIQKPFYVDFMVMSKSGRIGLFDTKAGITAETAKERAEGLSEYISKENLKGKNLFGGIVVQKEGSWRYQDGWRFEYNPNDLSGWEFLDLT